MGETGLDFSEGFPEAAAQLPYFEAQVALACKLNLPLFLHEREAFDPFVEILDRHLLDRPTPLPVVVHCFTSSPEALESYVSRGFYIGLTGYLIRKNKADPEGPAKLKDALSRGVVPASRLMIETDAPYMGSSTAVVGLL